MKRFRYILDPICLTACILYAVNRWALKRFEGPGFLHDHFNDLLFIPAALPWVLGLQRILRLRHHDQVPTATEVFSHLLIWTVICEWVGPCYFHLGTADWADAVAYTCGAVLSVLLWHKAYPKRLR